VPQDVETAGVAVDTEAEMTAPTLLMHVVTSVKFWFTWDASAVVPLVKLLVTAQVAFADVAAAVNSIAKAINKYRLSISASLW
jgi:hypothetical protein